MTARRAWRHLVVDPIVGLAGNYPTLVALGYRIRPYDMLTDRRRWLWQKPRRCGLPTDLAGIADAFIAELEQDHTDYRQWKTDNPHDAHRWELLLRRAEQRHRGR